MIIDKGGYRAARAAKNIDIYLDIDMASPENIDVDKDILENIFIDIDLDKGILQNIDCDKILYISLRIWHIEHPHPYGSALYLQPER